MKITSETIQIEMSVHEARIIAAFVNNAAEEDPNGEASKATGENIEFVVKVMTEFKKGLENKISS